MWNGNEIKLFFNVPGTIRRLIIYIMASVLKAACDVNAKKRKDLEKPGREAQPFLALNEMLTGCFRYNVIK